MRHRVDELESIRQSLQDQLWEFHQIERDLKDEIHQLNMNQVDKDQLKAMDEKISLLQISEANLTKKNKDLEKTEQMLRSRLAPIEHLDPKMIVKMKNQILSLEKADKHLKKYIRELEDSQKCLGSENKELLAETDRLRETVQELQNTEKQLVDKIFELEEIENQLQRALVEKDHRSADENAENCERLNNEIIKMQYESSILIFEATMKEKDLELEHERGLTRVGHQENASLRTKIDRLESDMLQLRVNDEESQQMLKDVETKNSQLVHEVHSLRSANQALAEREDQLQTTLQKMEDSLQKSHLTAEREKEKAAVFESELEEKTQLISEIQALNLSLSQQVEDYMNDIIDLKYVIGEQQPKVALLKEKEAKIAELQTQNEILQKEADSSGANAAAAAGGGGGGGNKILRTKSLTLRPSLMREDEASVSKDSTPTVNAVDEQQQQQQQQQQQPPQQQQQRQQQHQQQQQQPSAQLRARQPSPLRERPRSSTFVKEGEPTSATAASETVTVATTTPACGVSEKQQKQQQQQQIMQHHHHLQQQQFSAMMMEYDLSSSSCASMTSSSTSKSTSDIPMALAASKTPFASSTLPTRASGRPLSHVASSIASTTSTTMTTVAGTRRSVSLCTVEELRKRNQVLTLYYSIAASEKAGADAAAAAADAAAAPVEAAPASV